MRKVWIPLALSLGLLLAAGEPAGGQAGRTSGKSYSSGRSSPSAGSRPSPSPSRPPSGKSYSSGGSKPPAANPRPAPSKPPAGGSSGSGKSYSSGGSKAPSGTKAAPPTSRPPSAPAPPPPAASSRPAPPVASPKGKSYSSGDPATRSAPAGKGYSSGTESAGRKPGAGSSYDPAAGAAQARAESRKAYTKGNEPRPNYTTPSGQARPIDPRDEQISDLRRQLDRERWANRDRRQRDYFGPYTSRPVVVYNDPYSSLFWWWLLSQSLDTQARWAYHHRDRMDEARYRELRARNARLEERVKELEAQGVPRDPSYTPGDVPPDLMYTDEYVEAAYNPQPAPRPQGGVSCARALWVLFALLLVLAGVAAVIWLVFFKRWGSTR